MVGRLAKLFVVLALAGSIGFHWVFLQTIAWAGMVISYSQNSPIVQAVTKTFDGQHPCKLCIQIAKGQRSEKKSEMTIKFGKLEFRYAPATFVFHPPSLDYEIRSHHQFAEAKYLPPPIPPPKTLPA